MTTISEQQTMIKLRAHSLTRYIIQSIASKFIGFKNMVLEKKINSVKTKITSVKKKQIITKYKYLTHISKYY